MELFFGFLLNFRCFLGLTNFQLIFWVFECLYHTLDLLEWRTHSTEKHKIIIFFHIYYFKYDYVIEKLILRIISFLFFFFVSISSYPIFVGFSFVSFYSFCVRIEIHSIILCSWNLWSDEHACQKHAFLWTLHLYRSKSRTFGQKPSTLQNLHFNTSSTVCFYYKGRKCDNIVLSHGKIDFADLQKFIIIIIIIIKKIHTLASWPSYPWNLKDLNVLQ